MDETSTAQHGGGFGPTRPVFNLGQHDSSREIPLTDLQYGHLINAGMTFVTTPVTNKHFHQRIVRLVQHHLETLEKAGQVGTDVATASLADPMVPPLTTQDTGLYPSPSVNTYIAYTSPWIDLCSSNPVVANVSRQVLNLEVDYANFCGVRSVVIPGPRSDASAGSSGGQGLASYARAIKEALNVGCRLNFLIHMPMYREPDLEEKVATLSALVHQANGDAKKAEYEIDLFSCWDSWHSIRTVCSYNMRLYVALRIPKIMPAMELQSRWFSEPLHYLTLGPQAFQLNKSGHPSLSKHHQDMIFTYMRLKSSPWLLLYDLGPDVSHINRVSQLQSAQAAVPTAADFPALGEAVEASKSESPSPTAASYIAYLKWLELRQDPLSYLEQTTLTSFQDWLQSPLQPLSDNLESATYEIFEGDPVKYEQYETAIVNALEEVDEWRKGDPSPAGKVVIAVAGSGRGPLVTRALRAAEYARVEIEVWAIEKNPNAYVYLLRQNEMVWDGAVTVVKTDMRAWKGPLISGTAGEDDAVYGKVDILVSELLGSFGDNELSPECLDGIQHVLTPWGISIPASYTAHLSPIATPRIHADLLGRSPADPQAFDTPWVVRLYALDFVARRVPDHPRFQQAWEFAHPLPPATLALMEARRAGGVVGGGGGSMAGAAGANEHNSRHCHLTFVCKTRGVVHGLAGYFESVLYESRISGETVEISTHPELIDRKSRDMISWFPIFFPLKQPLYFPTDTELEISMWRQTNDREVWYEWFVEAYAWVGPNSRTKVGESELCSSKKVACLM